MRLLIDKWIKSLTFRYILGPTGWARTPNHVSLDITRRCNLSCRMCYYKGDHNGEIPGSTELTLQEITSLVINRLKGVAYDITGGEPFVRKDILEIASAVKQKKAYCHVTTNGTLITRDIATKIMDEGLFDWMSISIHGNEQTHEAITRVPGSYSKALKGIDNLLSERAKRGVKHPGVSIAATISGLNMTSAFELRQIAIEAGVDKLSFGHAAFNTPEKIRIHNAVMEKLNLPIQSQYDDFLTGPPHIPFSDEDLETYIQEFKSLKENKGDVDIQSSPQGYRENHIRNHFLNHDWTYLPRCIYPWRNLRIGPDGTVTPCIGYVVGNVRNQDIGAIWNNKAFRHFRKTLYHDRLFPGCFRCCKLK